MSGGRVGREIREFEIGLGMLMMIKEPSILSITGIGSCIGLALRDNQCHASGLAHVVLPSSKQADDAYVAPGKYADKAVNFLARGLVSMGAEIQRMGAKLVGGAQVLANGGFDGHKNVESVRSELGKHNIKVIAEDVGSTYGRSMKFDTSSGEIVVRRYRQLGGIAELKDVIVI